MNNKAELQTSAIEHENQQKGHYVMSSNDKSEVRELGAKLEAAFPEYKDSNPKHCFSKQQVSK